jgi:hypothetical protein
VGKKSDLASSFARCGVEMDGIFWEDFFVAEHMDRYAEGIIRDENIAAVYFSSARDYTRYYPNIGLENLVPADFAPSERPWYKLAADPKNLKMPVWSTVYNDAAGHGQLVTAAAPVYASDGRLRGVVGIDIELDDIAKSVAGESSVAGGYNFLLDSEYKLIDMPSEGYENMFGGIPDEKTIGLSFSQAKPEFLPLLDDIKKNKSGMMIVRNKEKDYLLAFARMENTGWTMVSVVDSEDYLLPLEDIEFQVLGVISSFITGKFFPLVLIIVVLIFLAAVVAINRLTKPLSSLARRAEEQTVEQFEFKANGSLEEKDEVSTLGEIINFISDLAKKSGQKLKTDRRSLITSDGRKIEELAAKVSDLEKFQEAVVDREMRMIAMKNEINELRLKLKNSNK